MESALLPWQNQQWHRLLQQRQSDRVAHAYLLVGERGLGKKLFARQAAALLLCKEGEGELACGRCRSCQLLASNSNPDLLTVEPEDSKVIKIDQVRQLADFASKTSHSNSRKVVILHNTEALNLNAANALLKTLEEPPGSTVLLLVSDNPGRLLPTLRSRCQRILFTVPSLETAGDWLRNKAASEEDLQEALSLAGNRPLLALELLTSEDRQARNTVLKALAAMLEGRVDPVEFAATGKTLGVEKIMEWLCQTTSQVLKLWLCDEPPAVSNRELSRIYSLLTSSSRSDDEVLSRLMSISRTMDEARQQVAGVSNPNPQLVLESILWRWSRLAS